MDNHFKHRFSKKDIEIHQVEDLFQGFVSLKKYHYTHQRFDHSKSKMVTREILSRHSAVVALPFDPVLERVVLIEELRIGAYEDQASPWLYEIPAGLLDVDGESPEQTAKREVLEETGFSVGRVLPISNYWSTPGASNEYIYAYCVEVDTSSFDEGFKGLDEENEDIRCFAVSAQEAFEAVSKGLINNGAGVISLFWLQLNYQKVLSKWRD